jgi:predicted outer membrane repeat protein
MCESSVSIITKEMDNFLNNKFLINGGIMQRFYRLLLIAIITVVAYSTGLAQSNGVSVSGKLARTDVRIFQRDSVYTINNEYVVAGTLIIEPGTTVLFTPNGRLVDSTGGRIIADGDMKSTYTQNPNNFNPVAGLDPINNPQNWSGFADLNYFTYSSGTATSQNTINRTTENDLTVHPDKHNWMYNVVLNRDTRKLRNLQYNEVVVAPEVIISAEAAIMFQAARMFVDPNLDVNLKNRPWKRLTTSPGADASVDVKAGTIKFIGQPINNSSREWGQIIVLPGARAAFFRNCSFENFRKDTTVDRVPYYNVNQGGATPAQWAAINNKLRLLSNGSGGVITTFSARTWLLNCTFNNNRAFHRGGALQVLQAPSGYPNPDARFNSLTNLRANLGVYDLDKNPAITNRDGSSSLILNDAVSRAPRIDMIDEPLGVTPANNIDFATNDAARQNWDDARIGMFLGRFRNLRFTNNKIQLNNVGTIQVGVPPVSVTGDITTTAASFPREYGNQSFGGAIYIAGYGDQNVRGSYNDGELDFADQSSNRKIEVGLGVNSSIKINGAIVGFPRHDSFVATGNEANNYQSNTQADGSRAGAVYAGAYTSLIVAGVYSNNRAQAPFLNSPSLGTTAERFSRGGAVYVDNTVNRLQVVGGPSRDSINNATLFSRNFAHSGGAIYVDGNSTTFSSPVIGGADNTLNRRDVGFNIIFDNNTAPIHGGAVYTKRSNYVNGAGGATNLELIGYGGKYPVRFTNNTAGYAGGAICVDIPNGSSARAFERNIEYVRTYFGNNTVGAGVDSANITAVRGGGAVYVVNGNVGLVKGVEFNGNVTNNSNGGAITMVHPEKSRRKFFVSDLDQVTYAPAIDENAAEVDGIPNAYTSVDNIFVKAAGAPYPADRRMLTRFVGNRVLVDNKYSNLNGSGVTQVGSGTVKTTKQLNGAYWFSTTDGIAVGNDGTVVKLSNGGADWTYLTLGSTVSLNDVFFTNSTTGFAVGNGGAIFRTNNGGTSWTQVTLPPAVTSVIGSTANLTSIKFIGTNTAYVTTSNGYVIKTDDAFVNSAVDNATNKATNLTSAVVQGANNAFFVGTGKTILKKDGALFPPYTFQVSPANADFYSAVFTSANRGFVAGSNGTVLRTTNGGNDWEQMTNSSTSRINSLINIGANRLFGATEGGNIVTSTDGGSTWANVAGITNFNALKNIQFADGNTGYAVGSGGTVLKTTNGGSTWASVGPADQAVVDVARTHRGTALFENGIGLGGAIYLLDRVNKDLVGRSDSVQFNRVQIQNNTAFSGSAIYSDNYDLKLIVNRSLITGNTATSTVGIRQNVITGPVERTSGTISRNAASSDLVPATIYGEIQGPLPSSSFSVAANSIYNNNAKFLIRLPDAPNTKGVLAGTLGIGLGGTDTLRGNYWGQTEANVTQEIQNSVAGSGKALEETFFVASNGKTVMRFLPGNLTDLTNQGPFESINRYSYTPIPAVNAAGDENNAAVGSLPQEVLFAGRIYDIFDKGTDIKTADYSKRRMSPIEDFAVGIAPTVRRFNTGGLPSNNKYVKRYLRDPFVTETKVGGTWKYPWLDTLQSEFLPNSNNNFYHPIGYPLFLETRINYDGLAELSNHDPLMQNESVFFVINQTSGDYIRVNFKQVSEDAPFREVFRARVDLVPDSSASLDPNIRYNRASIRRTSEGVANLGVDNNLLNAIFRNADNEDRGAVVGRKYDENKANFSNDPELFSNRPEGSLTRATFFAGERYRALPVQIGDKIQIVSRTVLWNEGVTAANNGSMTFNVTNSTLPPVFTGNVIRMQTDTVVKIVPSELPAKRALNIPDTVKILEFLHRVALTEDRTYPQPRGTYSATTTLPEFGRGTDSIMTVTAVDTNNFYDPRSFLVPNNYPRLTYTWDVSNAPGLARWIQADTITAGNTQEQNPRDRALGYIKLRGSAINPYVIPGGEEITVTAANYPPYFRTLDSLRTLPQFANDQDALDKFINIYPSYFHAPVYDNANARFLQQDTVNVARNFRSSYTFRIHVVDSIPRIFDENEPVSKKERLRYDGSVLDTQVEYTPSVFTCGRTQDGSNRLKANLTDKLRFQMDVNSDDELEDAAAGRNGWDFRYGQTAYSFENKVRNGGQDIVVDTTFLWDETLNGGAGGYVPVVNQSRPSWLSSQYLMKYATDTTTDTFGQDFTTNGQLNVRIPRAQALQLLTPVNAQNNALTVDTSMILIVNDGHGGKVAQKYDIFVNVAPRILTTSLPDAKEDFDYNPDLLDSTRMIKVEDRNYGQGKTFQLIYSSFSSNTIAKDPCFLEAGVWDVTNDKVTPNWLKINPISGLLYGTPGIKDAPKNERVVVLVTDDEGLNDLRIYNLRVDSTRHRPVLSAIPNVNCVDIAGGYVDTLVVTDADLRRSATANPNQETVTLTVVSPSGLTLEPSTITGPTADDKDTRTVVIRSGAGFNPPRDQDGKITVRVEATDASGLSRTLVYRLKVSDETRFVSRLKVTNSINATQLLDWGIADRNVSTGDGTDNAAQGKLDSNYCEFELPPYPVLDAFDARWTIPTINGTVRSIYPASVNKNQSYFAQIQPGGETGGGSGLYPITISWDKSSVPARTNTASNPTGATWYLRDATSFGSLFNVNMNTGDARLSNGFEKVETGNNISLVITNSSTKGFVIFQDYNSDVNVDYAVTTGISNINPNPVVNQANIAFAVAQAGNVKLEIVDLLGNTVETVINNQYMNAGTHQFVWMNADKVSSGSYLVKLTSGNVTDTYQMSVVK